MNGECEHDWDLIRYTFLAAGDNLYKVLLYHNCINCRNLKTEDMSITQGSLEFVDLSVSTTTMNKPYFDRVGAYIESNKPETKLNIMSFS